jgi:hypothetical protein
MIRQANVHSPKRRKRPIVTPFIGSGCVKAFPRRKNFVCIALPTFQQSCLLMLDAGLRKEKGLTPIFTDDTDKGG